MKEVKSHLGNLQSKVEPRRIKNINMEILMWQIPRYESLIDENFSYFHPWTLLVRVNSDALVHNNFIQVLLDERKDWERVLENGKQCEHSDNMCWHYFLKGFKILESTTSKHILEFQW
ncbi:hypothetical protein H5410_036711 [Solanum commersonii]|uniref:Uncharacterized protein n=1 Tax=Solanum commersonii TaxID=4109 RepID=A0A9J5Y6F3_SOLCO|nr:hypothetical protein H5410_036711 [Solanum commersonii]